MEFGQARVRRRPSLTPMIDVVFLLLVFFMLAARFGADTQMMLNVGGSSGAWSGPPRLVDIAPDGIRLNGQETPPDLLAQALTSMMQTPQDTVVLRARDVPLQKLVAVMDLLRGSGMTRLVLVE